MTAFAKGFRDSGGGNCAKTRSVSVQVDIVQSVHLTEGVYEIKRMEPRSSRLRSVILICLLLAVAGIVGFGYFCNEQVRERS